MGPCSLEMTCLQSQRLSEVLYLVAFLSSEFDRSLVWGICPSFHGDMGMNRMQCGSLFFSSKATVVEDVLLDSSTSSTEERIPRKVNCLDWESCFAIVAV